MNYKAIITKAAVGRPNAANVASMATALDEYGARFGLDQPHRLAHFLAQVMHESGDFRYDKEIWGPTKAQKGYEGRKDLGNTQKGDGKKFAGHGPIQVTGRANHKAFYDWCVKNIGGDVPDFTKQPERINTDPWEGLSAIWYWNSRDLNRYADQNDIEMITRRINGGLNGFNDRLHRYDRVALVILGYGVNQMKDFQATVGLTIDGIGGPRTRAAMHKRLMGMTGSSSISALASISPVVETKHVMPDSVEKKVKKRTGLFGLISTSGFGLGGWGILEMLSGANPTNLIILLIFVLVVGVAFFVLRRQLVDLIRGIQAEIAGEDDE